MISKGLLRANAKNIQAIFNYQKDVIYFHYVLLVRLQKDVRILRNQELKSAFNPIQLIPKLSFLQPEPT